VQTKPETAPTYPLGPFEPSAANPVLVPAQAPGNVSNVYNPAAVVRDGEVWLLYRAHGPDLVSSLWLAHSPDGRSFECLPEPVFWPEEPYESHGCEDPRVTEVDGTYYLTYTAYDGETALLSLATSQDLVHWRRHGPLFPDFCTFAPAGPRPRRPWSKAGGILDTPLNGRYVMYFGEGSIYYATSEDLVHWEPATGEDEPVLAPRPGTFMSDLVEVGPQPVMTQEGKILLVHNGAVFNADGTVNYSCGQALLSPEDPGLVLAVMDEPWLAPRTHEEHNGLVPHVTFVEGLVPFGGEWLAYYGQSDTSIGVAVHAR
jgi:predicted GH43/DUF377 family glycosyl hydrolase